MYIYINIYLYACIYKGLGAVSWAVMAEIMPTRPRAKAMSLFLSVHWVRTIVNDDNNKK